jgi:hypothetical protein
MLQFSAQISPQFFARIHDFLLSVDGVVTLRTPTKQPESHPVDKKL